MSNGKNTVWRMLVILIIAFLWGELDAYAANKAWVKYADGTLTFRYSEKESLDTDEYWLDKLNEYNKRPGWNEKRNVVTKVVFDKSFANARPTTCRFWFGDFANLKAIEGIGYLNTENVGDMNGMFDDCRSLTSLDVSKFNTSSVKDMGAMFSGCSSLTSLDLSNFNTMNVQDMQDMFSGCERLTTIYVSSNFVRHTKRGYNMFQGCVMLAGDIAYDENRDKTNDMDYATAEGGYFSHRDYTHPWVKYADGTLTFRYGYKTELGTDEYWLNTDGNEPGWSGKSQDVTKVVFDPQFVAARPTTCYRWFHGFDKLSMIEGIERLNTSNVTRMNEMFYGCSSLTSLDLSSFNTSKVDQMSRMFCFCSNLGTIYASEQFVTSGVSNSNGYAMFNGCEKLAGGISYDAKKTNVAYAKAVGGYFHDSQYIRPWVKYADGTLTFQYGYKKELGTAEYGLNEKHKDPAWCEKKNDVTKVVFDKSFAKVRPITCERWFNNFKYLSTIEGMENLNTSEVLYMTSMFYNCESLTSLDVSSFNTSKVQYMSTMFYCCRGLKSLDLSSFNTSKVRNMKYMFAGCNALESIYVSDKFVTSKVNDGKEMFGSCRSLVGDIAYDADKIDKTYASVDGGYFSDKQYTRPWVGYVNGGTLVFSYGYKKDLGFREYLLNEGGDTPGWYDIRLYVNTVVFDKSFRKALPTTCYRWFYHCGLLSAIEGLKNLNTSNVTDMSSLFYGCSRLTSLDVSNFNTSNVTNMQSMFYDCKSLTSLDLSSFNTSKVQNMNSMFKECTGLTSLDLSSFNTSNVTDMGYMFQDCYDLATIYANDKFVTSHVTEGTDMFQGCTGLAGGIAYDANKTNVAYAKTDGGYFTSSARPWVKYADGTLTFRYGKTALGTDEYLLNEDGETPGWNDKKDDVTKVVFDPSFAKARPATCYQWFCNFRKLSTIEGIGNLNTSNVTNMRSMFQSCSGLTSLDVSGFNTRNVTDMRLMFYDCYGLKSLDVSNFNTSKVKDMRSMFISCSGLESLDVSNFDTRQVTDMAYMFNDCSGLTSLDVSNFDTRNVKYMGGMFDGCSGLTSLDVSNFDTRNVTRMDEMFSGCSGLISLNLSSFDTRNVTDMKWMFNKCSGLAAIFVSEQFVTSSVTTDADMFTGCTSLVGDIAYDDSKTDKTYARLNGGYFMAGRPWVKYADGTLTFQYGLKATLDTDEYWLNVGSDDPGWYDKRQSVKSVVFDNTFSEAVPTTCYRWFCECENLSAIEGLENFNTSNVTNMSYMFNGCSRFTSLDVSNFDTRQVTDMSYMFHNCSGLDSLDVSNFDTWQVTDMGYMFFGCTGLDSLDVSNFDTRQVTDMGYVFCGCTGLTSLDVTNFDTQQVTDMGRMFNGCSGLTSLDVSRFNTSNVMYMGGMFNGCFGLTSLDVSKFNTSNVKNMGSMFGGCSGLTSLDLTNFNTSNVIDMSQMFRGCSGLTAIYASEAFQLSERLASEEMFAGCVKLQGDIAFDANHIDKTYAKLQDGYFADKAYIRPWVKSADGTFTFYYGYKRVFGDGEFALNDAGALPDWNGDGLDKSRIRKVVFDASFAVVRPTSCASWFADFTELQSVEGLYNLNTSEVTNMNSMFLNCKSLRSLDLTFFDTEQVMDMGRMFEGCIRMETLDLMSFDTHKISYISQMFYGDKKLRTIYASESFSLSHLEDSKYMNFQDIFTDCVSLAGEERYNPNWDKGRSFATTIQGYFLDKQYIRPWVEFADGTLTFNYGYKRLLEFQENYVPNTSGQQAIPGWIRDHSKEIRKVIFDKSFAEALPTYSYGWFSGCENLTEIVGLMYLNTSEVYDMGSMFEGCTALTSLDLSQFDTRNVSEMSRMFSGCSSLAVIYTGDKFMLSTLTSGTDMFAGCENLKGDIAYDASIVDKTYAKNQDGYFLNGASIRPWAKYDGGVLTFYYGEKPKLENDEYEMNAGRWGIDHKADITKVVFDKSFGEARPTTCANWFGYCDKLTTIEGLENLNTSEVESMKAMFYRCSSLTVLDLSHFDTQGVTDMSWMFMSCNSLATVNLSSFNTSKVTDMNAMFAECKSLTSLDLSNFDTQYVKDMSNMFSTCEALTTLNVSKFDTKNVSDMRYMFELCDSLASLDISSFDTQNVSDMRYMFSSNNLRTIYASESFVVKEGADDEYMFAGCNHLYGDIAFDANYTDKTYAKCEGGYFTHKEYTRPWVSYADGILTFRYGYKKELDDNQDEYPVETDDMFPKWVYAHTSFYGGDDDITKAVFDKSFAHYLPTKTDNWLYNCKALETVEGLENVNTSRLTSTYQMFADCSSLKSLDLTSFNTENVENMNGLFQDCSSLETIDLKNFNTQKASNFYGLFSGCSALKSLDLKNFDTKNVESMGMMFYNCSGLTDLDLGSFDTQKVTDMSSMFSGCSGLRALDLKNFDTKAVTSMGYMFWRCANLTDLDVSGFETQKLEDMGGMFSGCSSLKTLDVCKFDTKQVYSTNEMFAGCSSLETLDLSKFNVDGVRSTSRMFKGCTSLTTLILPNFKNVSYLDAAGEMFSGCSSLEALDLSTLTAYVYDTNQMFANASKLKAIYFSDGFDVDNLEHAYTEAMFEGCPATLYCSPLQYEKFKGNRVIVFFGNAVKPYVSINQKSEYGTLCVPVGSSLAEGSFTGFDKLYQVKDADKDKGTITMVEAKRIEPGVPYVYHRYLEGVDFENETEEASSQAKAPVVSVLTFDVDKNASAAVDAPKNEGSLLKGTFESMVAPGGSYSQK